MWWLVIVLNRVVPVSLIEKKVSKRQTMQIPGGRAFQAALTCNKAVSGGACLPLSRNSKEASRVVAE